MYKKENKKANNAHSEFTGWDQMLCFLQYLKSKRTASLPRNRLPPQCFTGLILAGGVDFSFDFFL